MKKKGMNNLEAMRFSLINSFSFEHREKILIGTSKSYVDYYMGLIKIEQEAKREIITNLALEPTTIQYIYEDLFSDFIFDAKHQVWLYQRK